MNTVAKECVATTVPPASLATAQLLRLSALWIGLEIFWAGQQTIVLPQRVAEFVPEGHFAAYYALVRSGGALITILTQLTIGFLSDHAESTVGRRRPFIMRGVLWGCAAIVLFMFAPNYWLIFCSYLLLEFFINSASVPFQSLLPDLVPEHQVGRAGAIMSGYHLAGNLTGVVVFATLALLCGESELTYWGRTLPLRFVWLVPVYILALVVTMLVVYYGIDEKGWARKAQQRIGGAVIEIRALSGVVIRFARSAPTLLGCMLNDYKQLDIRGRPNLVWLALSRFVVFLGYWTFLAFVERYITFNLDTVGWLLSLGIAREQLDSYRAAVQPVIIGLFTVGGLAGALFGLFSQERVGKKNSIIIGMLLAGAMVVPLIITHSVWIAIGAGMLIGCGWGMFLAADWAFAMLMLPKGKVGSYMGMWDMTTLLPQIITPIIATPFVDGIYNLQLTRLTARLGEEAGNLAAHAHSYQWLFATIIVYFLIGLWLLRHVQEERRPGFEQQP